MSQSNISEASIQRVLERLYWKNPQYVTENFFVFRWESDFLIKTKSGYWHEVEIKISFSDFKNDAKHKREKFEILEKGEYIDCGQLFKVDKRPNFFSYCVTKDMVDKVLPLLPEYAGLYYVSERRKSLCLHTVKPPFQIHKEKISDESLNLTAKFYYNYRTWKNASYDWSERMKELNYQIRSLKAEYKAATGCGIEDVL